MNNQNLDIENSLLKAKAWKRTHPRGYQIVVARCNEMISKGVKDIHLAVLLFELVRDSKISICSGMDKPLARLMESEFPHFKNHIYIDDCSTYRSERAAAIQLLQKILEI